MVSRAAIINTYVLFVLWDNLACGEQRVRKKWPKIIKFIVNESNVINEPLLPRKKYICFLFHIKLSIMKQFKVLLEARDCFNYICRFLLGMSNEKLEAGIFDGPQIQELMNDSGFIASTIEKESTA